MQKRLVPLLLLGILLVGTLSACRRDKEEEDPIHVREKDGLLMVRTREEKDWQTVLDLGLLAGPEGTDTGEIDTDGDHVRWRLSTDEEFAPVIDLEILAGLLEGTYDHDAARLRRNIDRLETYDEEEESWRLLFNLSLVHDAHVFTPEDVDDLTLSYQGLGGRIPLLEAFGIYEGWAEHENIAAGREAFDEETGLYLPYAGFGYHRDLIDMASLTNTEGYCTIPSAQKCHGGVVKVELGSVGADQGMSSLIQSEPFNHDGPVTLEVGIMAMAEEMTFDLRLNGTSLGTIDSAGFHTFTLDDPGDKKLMLEAKGAPGDPFRIAHVHFTDDDGDTLRAYDGARLYHEWNTTNTADRKLEGATGIVASFNYNNYEARLGRVERFLPNRTYDEIIAEHAAVCGEKAPHPADPDDEDMWVFAGDCPIIEVKGKGDEIVYEDEVYFTYATVVREYRFLGFERMPYVFFGTGPTGITLFADDTIAEAVLPEDMETLPRGAFHNASRLERVVLPENLVTIDTAAFQYAAALQEIILPESLRKINDTAFYQALSLEELHVPAGVESIGPQAFAYTENLKEITLPESLETLGVGAFSGSGIETLTIPSGLTAIERMLFARSDIRELVLPKNIETIYQGAFDATTKLETLVIERDEVVPLRRSGYHHGQQDEWAQAFFNTNEDVRIYVPDEVLSDYLAHPSWQSMKAHLHPLSERENGG